jgi:hypothetical protein
MWKSTCVEARDCGDNGDKASGHDRVVGLAWVNVGHFVITPAWLLIVWLGWLRLGGVWDD